MPVSIICVGHDKSDPLTTLASDYLARTTRKLSPKLLAVPVGRRKGNVSMATVEAQEGAALLDASKNCYRIALSAEGKQLDSEAFAKTLDKLLVSGREVAFLIGGATGLSEEVRQKSDALWSLSSLTFPHKLALLVLCEQIYRSGEILRGGPYHK